MVSKKCPDCDQTLPVACKSCPCGHVFISKKQSSPQDKIDNGDGSQRDQRLRPEVPKVASKDFDYHYGTRLDREQEMLSETQLLSRIVIPQPPKPVHMPHISQPSSETQHMVLGTFSRENNTPVAMANVMSAERPTIGEGDIIARRKRGRPKGSKNKPKPIIPPGEETSSQDDSQNTESGDPTKRKRGRPKGSKNKPKDPLLTAFKDDYISDGPDDIYQEPYIDHMPHISKEKAISYSIVLSDINQKMMKQSSMNFIK